MPCHFVPMYAVQSSGEISPCRHTNVVIRNDCKNVSKIKKGSADVFI